MAKRYFVGVLPGLLLIVFLMSSCDNEAADIVFPPDGDHVSEQDGDVDILEVEENGDNDDKDIDGDEEDLEPEVETDESDAITETETDALEDSETDLVDTEEIEEDLVVVCNDATSPVARRSDMHPGTWQPLYPAFAPHLHITDAAQSMSFTTPAPHHKKLLRNSRMLVRPDGVPELLIGHDHFQWTGTQWSRSTQPWRLFSTPAQASGPSCDAGLADPLFDFSRRYYQPAGRGFDPWFLFAGMFGDHLAIAPAISSPVMTGYFNGFFSRTADEHWLKHVPVAAEGWQYAVTDNLQVMDDGSLYVASGMQQIFFPDNQVRTSVALWDIGETADYSPRDIDYQEHPSTPENAGNVFVTSFRYRDELYAGTYFGQLARLHEASGSWQWVYDIDCDTGLQEDSGFEMLRHHIQFDDGGILACAVCGKCITMNMDDDTIGEVDISGDFQDIIAMTKGVDNDAWIVQARYYVTGFPLKLRTIHYLQSGEMEIFEAPTDPGVEICDDFENPSIPLVCDSNTWEVLSVDMDTQQQPVVMLRANPMGGEYVLAAYRDCAWEYEVLPRPVLSQEQQGELNWYRDMLFWDEGNTVVVGTINGWMIRGDGGSGPIRRIPNSMSKSSVIHRLESPSGVAWMQAAYGTVADMAEDVDGSLVMQVNGGLTGPQGCGVLRVSETDLTEIEVDYAYCGSPAGTTYKGLYETAAGVYVKRSTGSGSAVRDDLFWIAADSLEPVTVQGFPDGSLFRMASLTGNGNGELFMVTNEEGYAIADNSLHFVWQPLEQGNNLFVRMKQQGYRAMISGGVLLPGGGMYAWSRYQGNFFAYIDGDWHWEASLGGPLEISVVKNRLFALQEGNIDERALPDTDDMRDMTQCNEGYFPLTDSIYQRNDCSFPGDVEFVPCEGDICPLPAGEYCLNSYPETVKVWLSAISIDKYEISNGRYTQCVAAGACTLPATDASFPFEHYYSHPDFSSHPVTNVTLAQAAEYCQWAGGRLPTIFEWMAAAGAQWDIKYPWGNALPHKDDISLVNVAHNVGYPVAADACPDGASPYGAMHMMGNVAEWTMSVYPDDYLSCREGCDNPLHSSIDADAWYSLMGGAFAGSYVFSDELQRLVSDINAPEAYSATYGFRCVYDMTE